MASIVASSLSLTPIENGSLSDAPIGSHVVLEAAGVLLHTVRVPEGLIALRGGSVRSFQVARMPPTAAIVCYPPPFGPLTDAEAIQAVERARNLVGLDTAKLVERLVRAGADEGDFSQCAESDRIARVSECVASFCATGAARCWRASEAYRNFKDPPTGLAKGPRQEVDDDERRKDEPESRHPRLDPLSKSNSSPSCASKSVGYSELNSSNQVITAGEEDDESFYSSIAKQGDHSLHEKVVHTAVHAGLRGPAARVGGVAAAVGFEGYRLYQDIGEHREKLDNRNISADQYQERVVESSITSTGRAIGGLAGAAAGQMAIPVPVVGAVVGGVVGSVVGGFQANSFTLGAFRLTGGKARGGDDLVRCIEHKRPESQNNLAGAPTSGSIIHGGVPKDSRCLSLTPESSPSASAKSASRGSALGGLDEDDMLL